VASYLERFDQTPDAGRWALVRRWMFEEPPRLYAELRKHRPVLVMPELVLASRYVDCVEILRRFDVFSVTPYAPKQGDYWMAQDDTAIHWREKSIMRAILDREDIPAIRTYVGEKVVALLASADGTIDAVDGLTRAVPIALVQDWFGFADSDRKELQRWSYWNQMDAFWNQPFDAVAVPDPAQVVKEREAANAAMRAYLIALVQRRAAELQAGAGGSDPVSRLLRLSLSKALKFEMDRVVLNVGGLLIGAVETTSHASVNALDVLLQQPELLAKAQAAAVAADPRVFDGYVFEALRFKPAFPYFFRVCERDTSLARGTDYETLISAGQTVLAVTHSAMFDEVAFAHPDQFDPDRELSNTFHFGLGLHECLGRAIGTVMIPEIVRQSLLLPDLQVGSVDRKGGPVPESWRWHWRTL
jgi:cytochrome P450